MKDIIFKTSPITPKEEILTLLQVAQKYPFKGTYNIRDKDSLPTVLSGSKNKNSFWGIN